MATGSNPLLQSRQDPELFPALFERANDAILVFEPVTEVIFEANPKACELYGFTRDELVGRTLKSLTKDVARGERQIHDVLREGKYDLFETVHFNRSGAEMQILANASVIEYHGQRAILSINRDVSELCRIQHVAEEVLRRANEDLEERVRRRTAELERTNAALQAEIVEHKRTGEQLRQAQKLEAIGRLAGGVAHDFNNILMLIIGYAAAILNQPDEGTAARSNADHILKAAERATSLTRQLLAFGRKQVMAPRVLDLNAVLAEFSLMLPRLLGEDVELIFEAAPDLGRVKADPAQIELAVMNLALNARDAMPDGGKLHLATRNERRVLPHAADASPADFVVISIRDTGHGMDRKTQSRIFEPFFSTKNTAKGTGLGLASVHGIVTQTGGHITVESEPGRGTTFEIFLPRVAGEIALAQHALPLRPPQGSETILLVEDEPGIRELSRAFLENLGYAVLEARSGAEALRVAAERPENIDLLITDVIMPGMRGTELVSRLKETWPELKVLYISGFADLGDRPDAPLLEKPFAFETLGMEIRNILEGRTLRKAR
jgi:PAS domain S-box-containing protein